MSRKPRVRIRPKQSRGRDGVEIVAPSHQGFRAKLEGLIPGPDRWYNEGLGRWWVSERYADVAEHFANEIFGFVEVEGEDGQAVTHTPAGERLVQGSLL